MSGLPDLKVNTPNRFPQPLAISTDDGLTWIAPAEIELEKAFFIGFGIKNAGDVTAEEVPYQVKVNDTVLFERTLNNIRNGGSYFYYHGNFCFDPGEYTITILFDHENIIQETNENNNTFTYSLSVPGNQNWLIKTSWTGEQLIGENIRLNEYAPIDPATNLRSVAGCANVAMVQMLVYFASQGYDFTINLTEEDAFISGGRITIDGSAENAAENGTISFAQVNELLEDFDETSAEDIAALCYASGVIAESSYSSNETSTSGMGGSIFARAGFASTRSAYKGYSDLWNANGDLSDKAWDMLIRNMQEEKPVFTSIPNPGHVIVVDGYDSETEMVHINFGWGIGGGKRYESRYGLYEGSGWYSRSECDALGLREFTYDITPDTTAPVAENVTCTVNDSYAILTPDFSDEVGIWKKYYRTANSSAWTEYTDNIRINRNTTVYFKACDRAKNYSAVTSFAVTGIIQPESTVSNLTGNANGVSWSGNGSTFAVEYSLNNFANVIKLETTTNKIDTYNIGAGAWQVRVDSEAQTGFTATAPTGSAAQIVSDADGNLDVFFARTAGTWTSRHAARHTSSLNGWRGTNERVALTGKNIISDVFAGSTDANVLILTDDANGDALFLDDVFTTLGNQARLSHIDEIRAGAGNDVIDLTSPKFAYLGDEMTVFGGAGDDTIWANSGENTLYGDAGNDRIIGGAGNDFIIGGAGNDALHGGGGSDTFCFGANWGTDTVEQLANGKVILRFETGSMNNWNASTGVYSDGSNSVTVTGSGDIELYFGTASTLPEDAFAPAASNKIFEQLA